MSQGSGIRDQSPSKTYAEDLADRLSQACRRWDVCEGDLIDLMRDAELELRRLSREAQRARREAAEADVSAGLSRFLGAVS